MKFDPQKPIAQKFYTSWRDMVYTQEKAFGEDNSPEEAAAARERLGGVEGQGITSETGSAFRNWEHHVMGIIGDLRFQNDFLRHNLDLLTDEETPQPNGWETELAATDAAIAEFRAAAEPTTEPTMGGITDQQTTDQQTSEPTTTEPTFGADPATSDQPTTEPTADQPTAEPTADQQTTEPPPWLVRWD